LLYLDGAKGFTLLLCSAHLLAQDHILPLNMCPYDSIAAFQIAVIDRSTLPGRFLHNNRDLDQMTFIPGRASEYSPSTKSAQKIA
jgi:hypothetical protein